MALLDIRAVLLIAKDFDIEYNKFQHQRIYTCAHYCNGRRTRQVSCKVNSTQPNRKKERTDYDHHMEASVAAHQMLNAHRYIPTSLEFPSPSGGNKFEASAACEATQAAIQECNLCKHAKQKAHP
ncbi:unnamed protein product [Prorocentrum cordatum]|uniref:Uncharacterized protein n=1 Tax=Prorocentrum cordatum TaxID=2364126 RepID=A0ABN9RMC2_9DINO|nr:unnamed protein product [Polarella glacialis]